MLPENNDFFVRGEDGEEYGPVGLDELRDWVQENRAGLGTEVRRDEPNAPWHQWQMYPELVALLAEAHATGPDRGVPGMAPGSLWKRLLAFAMDLILSAMLSSPILIALALLCLPDWMVQFGVAVLSVPQNPQPDLPSNAKVVVSLISDVMLACYMGGFHAIHGYTPGKAFMHLRVVDQNGEKPSPAKSFLRALVLIISMGLLFIPFVYVFLNPQRRAFHDMIADTYVVES